MAVMQRGALKATAKAGAFLMRAAHLVAVLQAKRRPEPHQASKWAVTETAKSVPAAHNGTPDGHVGTAGSD